MSPKTNFKVIIIGAGVAGLCAANHFMKNQIEDFLILEARNRIGGRVIAIDIEGRHLELGANWIHGVLGNPIYELASIHGLVPIVQSARPHTVLAATEDGTQLPFPIVQEMYDIFSLFLKRCEEYYLCQYLPPEGIRTVGQHLRLERDLYMQQLPEAQRHHRHLVFDYLMRRETCITGAGDLDLVDLAQIGSYTELPGGNITLPAGYSSILSPLAKDIPEDKIMKGHPVTIVKWDNRNVSSEQADSKQLGSSAGDSSHDKDESSQPTKRISKPKIEVRCENGDSYFSDSVICTVPLGVLKISARTMFDPPLSDSKVESIDKLCFGTVDKIYLEYERPFFSAELVELILLWEAHDPIEDVSKRWYRKIYSFTKLNDTLLLGWISGEEAKYMETLPFDDVAEQCTKILRQFLGDPCVPKPKRCICTSWWSQPYSRGSYTSIGVGGTQQDITNVAAPVWSSPDDALPSLLFAGEHCHSSFYSTVHGAYLSGRDAAQYLCEQLAGQGQPPAGSGAAAGGSAAAAASTGAGVGQQDSSQQAAASSISEGTQDISSWLRGIRLN